jgi:hypothetical protein
MAFTEAERTDIRRFCGYPAYGNGTDGYQGWRFNQVYGAMEFRIQHLSGSEEAVVRQYLGQLVLLERAVPAASDTLDTAQAAVWTRNADELAQRLRLLDDWRRRLCGFLGLPPGPALEGRASGGPASVALVV